MLTDYFGKLLYDLRWLGSLSQSYAWQCAHTLAPQETAVCMLPFLVLQWSFTNRARMNAFFNSQQSPLNTAVN